MSHSKIFKIYLASQSPRRRDYLTQIGVEYTVVHSGFDESTLRGVIVEPRDYVCANAMNKGRWVIDSPSFRKNVQGPTLVISADTIVVLGKTILEKPKDSEDAKSMLQSLSGKTHTVLTSLCFHYLKSREGSHRCVEETFATDVLFRNLSSEEINLYVQSGEAMDKAGSYALQGRAASFVREIRGSNTNVIGIPLAETVEWLEKSHEIFQSMV